MPIYEYTCQSCKKPFEHFARSMSATTDVKCPACGSTKTARALSVFAVSGGGGGASSSTSSSSSGHVHSGTCGCGKPRGSCGM